MPASSYRSTLDVYVAWHPAFERGRSLADRLYSHLSRDPDRPTTRGVGVPVRFRSVPAAPGEPLPRPIPLDESRQAAVVALVDDEMAADPAWGAYVAAIWAQANQPDSPYRLFPVAFSEYAYNLHPSVQEANYIRLQGHSAEDQADLLVNRVTHELCRLLLDQPRVGGNAGARAEPAAPTEPAGRAGRAPVQVFLSHAKADGADLAYAIREYIDGQMQLRAFFDARDIPPGEGFPTVLEEGVRSSALLAVVTDAYATREWCRYEVLRAKRLRVPMIAVNALEQGEQRSFPYLGNVPTIRWPIVGPRPFEAVLGLMLKEVLRHTYFLRRCDDLRKLYAVPESVQVLPYPPELLTGLDLRPAGDGPALFIYPDPPLGTQEIELLREFDPRIQFTTPTMLPVLFGSR